MNTIYSGSSIQLFWHSCLVYDNDKVEKPNKVIHQKKSTEDVVIARKLVKILSVERATGFDTWIRVGWALRCIDDELYDAFEEFSQKCSGHIVTFL